MHAGGSLSSSRGSSATRPYILSLVEPAGGHCMLLYLIVVIYRLSREPDHLVSSDGFPPGYSRATLSVLSKMEADNLWKTVTYVAIAVAGLVLYLFYT